MKDLFFTFLLLAILSSCGDEADLPPQLRIKNVDNLDFDEVIVSSKSFGPLAMGEVSDYHAFDQVYRYNFVQIILNGDTCVLQPIDFVGETKYESGKFRYDLKRNIIPQFEDCFVELEFFEE